MTSLCVKKKKKKHVSAPDEFMMDKFEQTETEWFSIMTHE